jgi:hypothetical protein
VGDWTGGGRDGIGVVRGTRWLLRNTATPGAPDHEFDFGQSSGIPIVGDWIGSGVDTPGRFENGSWQLTNSLGQGGVDIQFTFGTSGDTPVVWRRR